MAIKSETPRVTDLLKDTAEQFMDLLAAQVRLARLELGQDVRALVKEGSRVAMFAPVIVARGAPPWLTATGSPWTPGSRSA